MRKKKRTSERTAAGTLSSDAVYHGKLVSTAFARKDGRKDITKSIVPNTKQFSNELGPY
jgi:hypothetical protein